MIKWIGINKWAFIMVLVSVVGCATMAGCFRVASPAKAAGESAAKAVPNGASVGAFLADIGSATAGAVVSEHISPYFLAGLGISILGIVTIALGGKATGTTLFLLGIATSGTGVLFVQYPWIVLVIAVVIGVLLAVMTYTRSKAQKQLEGTAAEAAQKAEEVGAFDKALRLLAQGIEVCGGDVKTWLREEGPDAVQAVKKVVSPIKAELAKAQSSKAETVRI